MTSIEKLQPRGEKMRKTVRWICETLRDNPGKGRMQVIREAEIRFDLSPLEANFISDKLGNGKLEEDDAGERA
jgi:hypothetical protein